MDKLFMNLYYVSLLLPAFSFTQIIVGVYTQNRVMMLPLIVMVMLYFFKMRAKKFYIPIVFLISYFLLNIIVGLIYNWDVLIYVGYFLTSILLLVSLGITELDKDRFLKFFKIFFLLNMLYVIFQLVCLNVGMNELAMIHSNLPAQHAAGYIIPVFVSEPFFRYTGLFNESSPFCFYLSIAFVFFEILGKKYVKWKMAVLFLMLMSGSKLAYMFVMLYTVVYSKYKIIRVLFFGVSVIFVYILATNFSYLMEVTNGEVMSIAHRLAGFELDKDIGILGSGLGRSSEGEVALNMYSILLNGFGYSSIIIMGLLFLFYRNINSKFKSKFTLPFLLATLSNGSLLIFQYTLLACCLVYLDGFKDFKDEVIITERKEGMV